MTQQRLIVALVVLVVGLVGYLILGDTAQRRVDQLSKPAEIAANDPAPKHRINEESFQLIRPGMTLEEVEAILGAPPGDYTKNKSAGYLLSIAGGSIGQSDARQYWFWISDHFGMFVMFTPQTSSGKFNGKVEFAERIPYVGVLPVFAGEADHPPGGVIKQSPAANIPEAYLSSMAEAQLGIDVKAVQVLAFSQDGNLMVTGHNTFGVNDRARVVVWDVARGTPRHVLEGHRIGVLAATVSPDGSLLATGDMAKSLCFWNMKTGEKLEESMR